MRQRNAAIANIQVILSILVVLIHADCVFINLPGETLQYIYGPNYSTFIQLFISEGISRIAVPMFFVLSGYLFYHTFDGTLKRYYQKLKGRLISLVIPYLFWSSLTFFAFYFAQKIPGLGGYFTTRNGSELSIRVLFDNIIISSYNSPLWFCRYLIVFSVLSIAFYWLYRYMPIPFIAILFYGWFFNNSFGFSIRTDAIFFYSLGALIALFPVQANALYSKARKWVILLAIIWLGCLLTHTIMLCHKEPDYLLLGGYDPLLEGIGKIGILIGQFVLWEWFHSLQIEDEWKIAPFSFLVFAIHHPIVNAIKKITLRMLGVSLFTSLFTYLFATLFTVVLILSLGYFTRKFLPTIYRIISGGR